MYNYSTDLAGSGPGGSLTQNDVINAFRDYWNRHMMWTRGYIIALINDTSNIEYISQRGIQNTHSLVELLNRFYRYQASRTVEDLLLERFTVSENVLKAIMVGDEAAYVEAKAEWFRLTDTLVTVLSSLNSYWDLTVLRKLVRDHYTALENEMRYRFSQRDFNEFKFTEADHTAQEIADYLARGIILQFGIMP